MPYELRTFGGLDLLGSEGKPVEPMLARSKAMALLAHLAVEGREAGVPRGRAGALLWPDRPEERAQNALRITLTRIRKDADPALVLGKGEPRLRLNPGCVGVDLWRFEDARQDGDAARALELYRGEFLAGVRIDDAPPFERWIDERRERYRDRAYRAAISLGEEGLDDGDPETARGAYRRASELRPLREEAVAGLLRALAEVGASAEALRRFDRFRERRRRELDLAPSAGLRQLVEEIRESVESDGDSGPDGGAPGPTSSGPGLPTVAVVPFDATGEEGAEVFARGLHGDLVRRLENLSGLHARSIPPSDGDDGSDPGAVIADRLDAGWLVEGEVTLGDDRIGLDVRLLDPSAEATAWQESFRQDLTAPDLFEISRDLTRRIATSLETEVTAEEARRVGRRPTTDLEAYRLYAQGQGLLEQLTGPELRRALEHFLSSVERDSSYAPAWAALADVVVAMRYHRVPVPESAPEPMRAARRALELDPELAAGHASLGLLHSLQNEGPEAVRRLERAVELRPGYAQAQGWLAYVYLLVGKPDAARAPAREAASLDPPPEAHAEAAEVHLAHDDVPEAIRAVRRAVEMSPRMPTFRLVQATALLHARRPREARSALRQIPLEDAPFIRRATEALTRVGTGEEARARELLTWIVEAEGGAFFEGLVHAALGERDEAFEAFGRVELWWAWPTLSLRHFYPATLDPIRADPRYRELLRDVNRDWGLEADGSLPANPSPASAEP